MASRTSRCCEAMQLLRGFFWVSRNCPKCFDQRADQEDIRLALLPALVKQRQCHPCGSSASPPAFAARFVNAFKLFRARLIAGLRRNVGVSLGLFHLTSAIELLPHRPFPQARARYGPACRQSSVCGGVGPGFQFRAAVLQSGHVQSDRYKAHPPWQPSA